MSALEVRNAIFGGRNLRGRGEGTMERGGMVAIGEVEGGVACGRMSCIVVGEFC